MPNMSAIKTKMSVKLAKERIKNFEEVTKDYTLKEAIEEANRCLNCKSKPCVKGCPVGINIPEFITEIKNENLKKAYEVLLENTSLPAICGRVCPQETQCEALCVRGKNGEPVAIGNLERFVADQNLFIRETHEVQEKLFMSVAIIGSGPAGLSCAGTLVKMGYDVTVFEALHEFGGVLTYGIPEFRLPKEIVKKEIQLLTDQGVRFERNIVIGKTLNIDELFFGGYEAIFIGTGAGLPKFLKIPGENLLGVYSANEFLTRINLMKAYEKTSSTPIYTGENVAVIGGGNVAMDAARCAIRMGAQNVYIVYRRSEEEMPARKEEVKHAKEEGIKILFLTNPIRIIGNQKGYVKGIKCEKMELGEPDNSGRRRPIVIEGAEHTIKVDSVIISIGTSSNPLIKDSTEELRTNNWGYIEADENGVTSCVGIYAGGDVVSGSATVINAMDAGKKAAFAIDSYLRTVD